MVAAETGSGKTHTYLIPLIQVLLEGRRSHPAPSSEALTPAAVASALAEGQEVRLPLWAQEESHRASAFVLVLCPNATLCQQVADMAHALKDPEGSPLLKIAVVAGGQQPPAFTPDIVVATPGGLLNMLYAFDRKRRRRTAFARDVRYVVRRCSRALTAWNRPGSHVPAYSETDGDVICLESTSMQRVCMQVWNCSILFYGIQLTCFDHRSHQAPLMTDMALVEKLFLRPCLCPKPCLAALPTPRAEGC